MDAERLFNANKERENAVDRLWDLIAVLDGANATTLSYKTIVEGNDTDNTMSEHKKESIRMRARYLAQAYQIALDSMPYKTWHDCCQEAINALATIHIRYIKNSRVLQRWNEDFETQETMLCLKAKEMGVMIDRTPKCHCELAGKGIEYAWGCAKNHYRRQPLKDKKGKEKFRQTVRKCFSR
jgi:hypothetical protein